MRMYQIILAADRGKNTPREVRYTKLTVMAVDEVRAELKKSDPDLVIIDIKSLPYRKAIH